MPKEIFCPSKQILKNIKNSKKKSYLLHYKPGAMIPSYYLSQHPQRTNVEKREAERITETELFINAVVNANLLAAITTAEVERATEGDADMQDLSEAITNGCLDHEQQPHLSQYRHVFPELSKHGNLIVRGHRLVVQSALRAKAVRLAHEAHQGIVKSKSYLWLRMWFP